MDKTKNELNNQTVENLEAAVQKELIAIGGALIKFGASNIIDVGDGAIWAVPTPTPARPQSEIER